MLTDVFVVPGFHTALYWSVTFGRSVPVRKIHDYGILCTILTCTHQVPCHSSTFSPILSCTYTRGQNRQHARTSTQPRRSPDLTELRPSSRLYNFDIAGGSLRLSQGQNYGMPPSKHSDQSVSHRQSLRIRPPPWRQQWHYLHGASTPEFESGPSNFSSLPQRSLTWIVGSTLLLIERVLEATLLGTDVDGRPEGANDGLEAPTPLSWRVSVVVLWGLLALRLADWSSRMEREMGLS